MSETLWGVVIGGLIGSCAPLAQLWFSQRQWKKQILIESLKEEYRRIEVQSEVWISQLAEAVEKESFNILLITDIKMRLPEEISELIVEYISSDKNDTATQKSLLFKVSHAIKKRQVEIEKQIRNLVS